MESNCSLSYDLQTITGNQLPNFVFLEKILPPAYRPGLIISVKYLYKLLKIFIIKSNPYYTYIQSYIRLLRSLKRAFQQQCSK